MATVEELRQAFISTRLLFIGWTFDKAMENSAMRIALMHIAEGAKQHQEENRQKKQRVIRHPCSLD